MCVCVCTARARAHRAYNALISACRARYDQLIMMGDFNGLMFVHTHTLYLYLYLYIAE
jgi:hypothetical protein